LAFLDIIAAMAATTGLRADCLVGRVSNFAQMLSVIDYLERSQPADVLSPHNSRNQKIAECLGAQIGRSCNIARAKTEVFSYGKSTFF
jgi:hypothetical protein